MGREVAQSLIAAGCEVLAVARGDRDLATLKGARTLSLDATGDDVLDKIRTVMTPDAIIVSGGALPCAAPLQTLDWETFSRVWETDVRMSLNVIRTVLNTPMHPGGTVIFVSSGAGINGSPISGGFAGAKKMQMFMTGYAQKESERLDLGIRFVCVVPMRPMANTGVGEVGIAGYSAALGLTREEFLKLLVNGQSPADVARCVHSILADHTVAGGTIHQVFADRVLVSLAMPHD